MSGEMNLQKLLNGLKPRLNPGEYVYCTLDSKARAMELDPLGLFVEEESVTVILSKSKADSISIPYSTSFAWITLTIHSLLEAVGLTAAVAGALTKANISCNVVAAFYHDHIFVPAKDAKQAMDVLQALTGDNHGHSSDPGKVLGDHEDQ